MSQRSEKHEAFEREAFARRLRALRHSFGSEKGNPQLSANDFAIMLGVQPETYRRYERGETEPNLMLLATIRRVTGVNLNSLVAGDIDRAA